MATRTRKTSTSRKPAVAPTAAPKKTVRLKQKINGFDFDAVAPQTESPDALPGSNVSTALDNTPILGWVQTSWENRTEGERAGKPCEFGEVASVAVPDHMVEPTADLLRAAAKRLGVGISIRPAKSENGSTRIYYRAQTKVVGRGRPVGSKNKNGRK